MKTKSWGNPWVNTFYRIKYRCENKNNTSYHKYGAKGIKCLITLEEVKRLWIRDKASLLKRPSIDRIDPDKSYFYDNCRFIELSENCSKRRNKGSKNHVKVLKYLVGKDWLCTLEISKGVWGRNHTSASAACRELLAEGKLIKNKDRKYKLALNHADKVDK